MSYQSVQTAFVIIAAIALVCQALLLFAVYRAVRGIHREIEGSRADLKQRLDPIFQSVQEILASSREPVRTIGSNLAEISRTLRDQTTNVDGFVGELVDKSRLQMIRIDQMLADLIRKVETTSDLIQRQVVAPIREASAVIRAVRVGVDYLFSRRRPSRSGEAAQDEQLFI